MIGLARFFIVTAYSIGCGATGLTQYSQREPVPYYTAAVDRHVIKGGSMLEMDAPFVRGHLWYAEDTGRDIKGNRIDLFLPTCQQARWWGVRRVHVRVVAHEPREQYIWWRRGLGK